MAFARFIPADGPTGPISDAESAYLASLIANAEARGKIAVLTATRGLGRMTGIKARFPGLHVLLYRNLFQQWCSYGEQAFLRNPYFLWTVNTVLDTNGHDPVLRQIREMFPCDGPEASHPNQFYRFVFLHLYLYGAAAEAADLVADVNQLEADAAYRDGIARRLAEHTGLPVTITGAQTSIGFSLVEPGALTNLESNLRLLSPLVLQGTSSATGRSFIENAMADLVREHDRYDFYTRRLAGSVTGATGLLAERDTLTVQAEAARQTVGQLRAERAELIAARDALTARRDDAQRTADLLRADQAALTGERDLLTARVDAATAQRDAAIARRDAAMAERAWLAAEHDAILVSTTWRLGKPIRLQGDTVHRLRARRSA